MQYFQTLEAWVTAVLLVVSTAFLVSSLGLPAGTFDPLGPGAAPEMVSGLLCLLCLTVLIRGTLRAAIGVDLEEEAAVDIIKREGVESPYSLAIFFVLLLGYLLAFQWQLGHFIAITTPFFFVTILLLGGLSLRNGIIALTIATGLSVGFFYVMTGFFTIRLPGI